MIAVSQAKPEEFPYSEGNPEGTGDQGTSGINRVHSPQYIFLEKVAGRADSMGWQESGAYHGEHPSGGIGIGR